jgi:redox-sensing transcriptional repressor
MLDLAKFFTNQVGGENTMGITVPDIVVSRLPLYLRALTRMQRAGQQHTSSHELSERLGASSAQIRKDLSHFGEFGKQGSGYTIPYLIEQLKHILHAEAEWPVALVGAGAIGHALAHFNGLRDRGFHIALLFDNAPAKIGQIINGHEVRDMALVGELIPTHHIRLAMMAVPAEAAQIVANLLVNAGVRGLLSYAPTHITVPPEVRVQYIDPVVHLQRMTFYLGA